jgi:cyclomaltodextrinase
VIEQLDYLQDLGIDAIYFTPIFQSASNHRYHTHDYYQVDPILGGNPALRELLDAAHDRNIKIVLDGVFNHASRGFFFFNDILENGPYSPWLDWFKIQKWPLSAYDGEKPANYVGWVGNRALPEFNHDNPDVREYIMEIAEYWLDFGIDGWRLDVAYEIETPGFWQEFRDRVKARNPEAYIVGEVWTDAREWLDGTQFDGVMNYLFTGPTIAFTAGDRVRMDLVEGPSYFPYPPLDAEAYGNKIRELLALYPWEIQLAQLNLLNSHDVARLISIVGGDKDSVKLATLLLFTFPGAPSIYYGDEIGLEGEFDPDSRRGFPPKERWDMETLDYHKRLIAIRHQYPALRTGSYEILFAAGMVYIFARILDGEELIIAVNSGLESVQISIPVSQLATKPERMVYGTCTARWMEVGTQTHVEFILPPRSGCILANR